MKKKDSFKTENERLANSSRLRKMNAERQTAAANEQGQIPQPNTTTQNRQAGAYTQSSGSSRRAGTNAPIYAENSKKARLFEKKRKRTIKLRRKKSAKLNVIYIALLSLCGCLFIFSGVMLTKTLLKYKQAGDEYGNIASTAVTRPAVSDTAEAESLYLKVDHAALEARNEDYMGWLDIPDTGISYPVVRAEDYWEYLYTTFDKVQNNAGCIFADYRCANDFSSKNTILYGHRMNDGSMFGTLKKYFDSAYLDAHREIHVYVKGKVLIYEVFSVYQAVAADESYATVFDSDGDYSAWLESVKAKSVVDTGVTVKASDTVLMLSTCKGGDNDDRTVVFAVLKEEVGL